MDHIALVTSLVAIVAYVAIIWASMETQTEDYRRNIKPGEDE